MKKMKSFFLLSLLLSLFAVNLINAQTGFQQNAVQYDGAGYRTITTECIIDSTDTLYTNKFDLANYNKAMTTFKLITPQNATDTTKINIKRQIYVFGAWRADKTIYTADSLHTFASLGDTTTASIDNRLMIYGSSNNDDSVKIYFKHECIPK